MSTGFNRNRKTRQRELSSNRILHGKYHVRIKLKDFFGFAEHREKAISGLGYKLTITLNSDNAVLNKTNDISFGKVKIKSIEKFVPHYTPSIPKHAISSKQILSKVPTELQYAERSVFMMK